MGELHIHMNITIDGVIQANGGPSTQDAGFEYAGWEQPYANEEAGAQIEADIRTSDALLLGRTTYDIWRPYWPNQSDEIARNFNRVPKYVASRGTPDLSWEESFQVKDAATEVGGLRDRHHLIHVWGSGDLLQTLFREDLVDQINLWVHPVVLGTGKRLFPEGTPATRFELAEPARTFAAGPVLMRYRRVAAIPKEN
jgi:dihydrofolate reductase